MKNHIVNKPITQDREEQSKEVHQAALKHWFNREKPVKREPLPINKEKQETIPCPPGIDQTYWQSLSKIAPPPPACPVQLPTLEQRRLLWQQVNEIKASKAPTNNQTDFVSQALRPADPFEEPLPRKARLLDSKVEPNVVSFASTKQVWKLASNE